MKRKHLRAVVLPFVLGLRLLQADLEYQVNLQSPGRPDGTVIWQSISGHRLLKKGRPLQQNMDVNWKKNNKTLQA